MDKWGRRKLAYPIQKKTTGIYHILEYKVPGEVNDQMEVIFGRDDAVMRHLTIRLDKYAVEYNEKRRRGEIGKKKSAEQTRRRLQNRGIDAFLIQL